MSEFKVGDEVWFFCANRNSCSRQEERIVVFPSILDIEKGMIVYIDKDKDLIHVYVSNCVNVYIFGCTFHEDYFFESKNEAINKMTESMYEMVDEDDSPAIKIDDVGGESNITMGWIRKDDKK